jgi:hypothetical protein
MIILLAGGHHHEPDFDYLRYDNTGSWLASDDGMTANQSLPETPQSL